jgi:hypothetical protein
MGKHILMLDSPEAGLLITNHSAPATCVYVYSHAPVDEDTASTRVGSPPLVYKYTLKPLTHSLTTASLGLA